MFFTIRFLQSDFFCRVDIMFIFKMLVKGFLIVIKSRLNIIIEFWIEYLGRNYLIYNQKIIVFDIILKLIRIIIVIKMVLEFSNFKDINYKYEKFRYFF